MSHLPLHCSQNFLRHPQQVAHLLALSSIGSEDIVYEIGPGTGLITDQLAQLCHEVVAIEKDQALAERLQRRYRSCAHVTIHSGDFLDFPLPTHPYKVFANIPFNLTHEIVTKLTSALSALQDAYLMMQREAAHKFCGTPREYLYSVLLKPWFATDILYHFRRCDFEPVPRVDVVMLRLRKRGPPLITARERQLFRDFAVYGFTTRQPTLDRILRAIFTHRQRQQVRDVLAIDLDTPPSALPFPQWLQLFHYFQRVGSAQARQTISGSERDLRKQQARLLKIHRTRVPG
jgi:23S rRNA (adenine-N6)-dimethyltransferase